MELKTFDFKNRLAIFGSLTQDKNLSKIRAQALIPIVGPVWLTKRGGELVFQTLKSI